MARVLGVGPFRGLCGAILSLHTLGRVTDMKDKVSALRRRADCYVWTRTMAGARARAAFCRRMARETSRR